MAGQDEAPTAGSIQAVRRAAEAIGLLKRGYAVLRPADVARELGLGRTTAHRYLATLAETNLLARHPDGSYGPGRLLVEFWSTALGSRQFVELAGFHLRRLVEQVHETCVLSVWGGDGPIVVACQVDEERTASIVVKTSVRLNERTAQWLVFLAYLPEMSTVHLRAAYSGVDLLELNAHLESVRTEGIAIVANVMEGFRSLAVPVLDDSEQIIATIGVLGTMASVPGNSDSGMARAVLDAGRQLSATLGSSAQASS
jgi:DNA-binding IclR family transcriptional regulator